MKSLFFGSQKLQLILNNQKDVYDKARIGYKPNNKQKFFKSFFISISSYATLQITCFCCGRIGHKAHICNFRKSDGKLVKKI